MLDVHVIEEPTAAAIALDPIRTRLLAELTQPASAAALATRLGITRQKIHYHLSALETHGLVSVAEERKWGGITERVMVATAESYVVSPSVLGPVATDPEKTRDRLSASYVVALGARLVREVGLLLRLAREKQKRLATLSIDTTIRFRSPAERAAFTDELTRAITDLASRYHDASAPGGRPHRVVIVAHPLPHPSKTQESSS